MLKVVTVIVHARSRHSWMSAPFCPVGTSTRNVGRRDVAIDVEGGRINCGGVRTHTPPERANPALQVTTHADATQATVEFAGALHTVPQ
jgi:hypothetical protein